MDEGPILCFQHCVAGQNITCLKVPDVCPICRRDTRTTPHTIPPFRLPCPFVNAKYHPLSIVIKPTNGNFLENYENGCNLHIGLTDTRGVVYHYNESGAHAGGAEDWGQCIAINVTPRLSRSQTHQWNVNLASSVVNPTWRASRYNAMDHNCYSFVLALLQLIDYGTGPASNQQQFCEQWIIPKTSEAAKYISLYRRLLREKYVTNSALT